ncbi:MAG TPA: hypothetical protein VE075_02240 [Thermoanaerobaculia bacterium]|nr:hypothetical protein [Thermoanaerobaculia bacterium]
MILIHRPLARCVFLLLPLAAGSDGGALPAAPTGTATIATPAAPGASAAGAVSGSRVTPWAAAGTVWTVPPFTLRDGFWINLHHFLFQQAVTAKRGGAGESSGSTAAELSSAEELTAWSEALRYYAASVVDRDLLFDRALNDVDYGLAALDDGAGIGGAGLPPEMAAALARAAPVYRAHWWPAHDRANRFWIAVASPLIQQLGPRMVEQLAAAYGERWPARQFLVDVAAYANWAGAYTSTIDEARPVHTIISSLNPGNQGFAALETLFHEASHAILDQQTDRVTSAIERECRVRGQQPPRGLTHAIIFYTAGELARRNLAAVGVAGYVPSAERYGLWTRAWPSFKGPLERFWPPYLDGKTTLDAAIAQIVQAVGAGAAKGSG